MPILHMLPGDAPGSEADLVISYGALQKLRKLLEEAHLHSHASAEFRQRDREPFRLYVQVMPSDDLEHWRDVPFSYLRNYARTILIDFNGKHYDADLLSAHLTAARKTRGHRQAAAAVVIGVSPTFVSNVERCRHVPKPENFKKLTEYIGTSEKDYHLVQKE